MLKALKEALPEFKIIKLDGILYGASKVNPKTGKNTHIPFFYTKSNGLESTVKQIRQTWDDICSK